MARSYWINGPTMVLVKGNSGTAISTLTELGLAQSAIQVSPTYHHSDIMVDAWGNHFVPADIQMMISEARVTMDLIHFDRTVLSVCEAEAQAGATTEGALPTAGTLMGGNVARFSPGNHYIGLNLSSPVGGQPWRFLNAYITSSFSFPLGTEKSVVRLTWRCIAYNVDPYNDPSGTGSLGFTVYDHTLDAP